MLKEDKAIMPTPIINTKIDANTLTAETL